MHENNKFCDIHNGNTILYNNNVENEKNNIAIFDDNQIRDEKNISNLVDNKQIKTKKNIRNLIDNKQTKTKKNISNSAKIKYIIIFFIYIILLLSIIISVIYIINSFSLKKEAEEESNLINTIEVDENKVTKVETERMLQVQSLKTENPDIVGWLEIKGTNVSYPVLQGSDNEFYMTHNYKKEKSKNGSIFLSKDYDWNLPSANLLIYGHNMQNGTMFEELLKYADYNFYVQHPIINFTTVDEDAEYEIISVFKSRVYYKSEQNVFRYYYFINAETEDEYNEFVSNAKNSSLYNIDANATYGDQLITLSTCSYHVKDGRFAVVGRKISSDIGDTQKRPEN